MLKIKSIGVITGLTFLYIWIYIFLGNFSNNMAYKENTYINKAIASIKVYENSWNNKDAWDSVWKSWEFPDWTYSKASIIYWNEATSVSVDIETSISYISRHSH